LSLTWKDSNVSEPAGFDRIIGNALARRILGKAARGQCPAHSYLFIGSEGVGKLTTAIQFAKALNCQEPIDSGACEVCATCRRIEHQTTTDLVVYAPEKNKTVISIEQMQRMREFSQLRPTTMRWKVMILERADALGDEAANCILKLLEDAPEYLVVIQAITNPASVLATIRSRSQVVRFYPPCYDELSERLADCYGVEPEKARFLSRFALGCPGKAVTYSSDESFLEDRDEIIEFSGQLLGADRWALLATAASLRTSGSGKSTGAQEDIGAEDADSESDADNDAGEGQSPAETRKSAGRSQRETAMHRLALTISWFRDLLAVRIGGDNATLINLDRRDQAATQSAMARSAESLLRALDVLVSARSAIASNANSQIVTESLVLQLASIVRQN